MVGIQLNDLFKSFLKIILVSSFLFFTCKSGGLDQKICRNIWENCSLFSYSKEYSKDKRIIAYHEAGHALAAVLLNLEIKNLIFDNGKLQDAALTQIGTVPNIYTGLKLYLAGYAAEEFIFGKATYNICLDLDEAVDDSYRIATNKILNDTKQTLEEILKENLDAVRDVIKKNKNKLIAIAEAFLLQNKLSGQEVLLLIKKIKN
jgi:ATP-dependent Zn protease